MSPGRSPKAPQSVRLAPAEPPDAALALLRVHVARDHPDAGEASIDRVAFEGSQAGQDAIAVWDRQRYAFHCTLCPPGRQIRIADPDLIRRSTQSPADSKPAQRRKAVQAVLLDLVRDGKTPTEAIRHLHAMQDEPVRYRAALAEHVVGPDVTPRIAEQQLERWIGRPEVSERTLRNYWTAILAADREAAERAGHAARAE